MNRNKLLTRQVAGNGILSHTFPVKHTNDNPKTDDGEPSVPASVAALTIIGVALVVAFYALLIIQFLYQPYA